MDHILSELGLRLTYLRGKATIDAIDQELVFEELLDGTPPAETPVWAARRFLSDYDHLVLASDLATGATLGILGAQDRRADGASFLWLETGFVVARARGRNLMRRMIALVLLRVASFGAVPDCVAALTRNPIALHVLRHMTQRLGSVEFAPASDGPVVDLNRTRLVRAVSTALGHSFKHGGASRAASGGLAMLHHPYPALSGPLADVATAGDAMLGLLDLRQAQEAGLMADLRKLYRSKGTRSVTRLLTAKSRIPRGAGVQSEDDPLGDIAAS